MTSKQKQILFTVIGVLALLGLGAATLFVIPRLSQTEKPVAPTAPESKPKAGNDWLGGAACNLTFAIAAEITGTPTPTLTPTSTPTPTVTPTNGPTATPTPTTPVGQPTPTPTRTTSFLPTPTPTPTTTKLPDAGIGLPTLGALGGGTVMILLGILLAL